MAFDVDGARKSGYSDTEIANYLASQKNFDADGARKSGYSDTEIIAHLNPAEQSALGKFGSNVAGVLEGGARTAANVAGTIIGFAPSYAIEKGIELIDPEHAAPEPAQQALGRMGEQLGKVPYATQQGQAAEEMIGFGFEKMMEYGGRGAYEASKIPGSPQWLQRQAMKAAGKSEAQIENEFRAQGELASNAVPVVPFVPGVTRAAKPAVKPAPSPYADLRAARPELAQMTDQQITDHLVAADKARTGEVSAGETRPLGLEEPPLEGSEATTRGGEQILSDWALEAEGERRTLYEQAEAAKQAESGTQDMFQGTGLDPVEPPYKPVDPLARAGEAEGPPTQGPGTGMSLVPKGDALEWGGDWKSDFRNRINAEVADVVKGLADSTVLQRTIGEVNGIFDQMLDIRNRAFELYKMAAHEKVSRGAREGYATETELGFGNLPHRGEGPGWISHMDYEALNREYLAKLEDAKEAMDLQAYQLRELSKEIRDEKGRKWAEDLARYISDDVPEAIRQSMTDAIETFRKAEDNPLGVNIEKTQAISELFHIPHWPDPKLSAIEKSKTLQDFQNAKRLSMEDVSTINERGGNQLLDQKLQARFSQGMTMSEGLRLIANEGARWQQWWAQKLLSRMHRDTKVRYGANELETWVLKEMGEDKAAAFYFNKTNEILLLKNAANNLSNVFLHEAMHSIVGGYIDKYMTAIKNAGNAWENLPKNVRERYAPVKALDDLYYAVATKGLQTTEGLRWYGLTDLQEFASELISSRQFQDRLRKMQDVPISDVPEVRSLLSRAKNMYEAAMRALKGLFQTAKDPFEGTALEMGFERLLHVMDAVKKSDQFFFDWEKANKAASSIKQLRDALPPGMKHLAETLAKDDLPRAERVANHQEQPRALDSAMDRIVEDLRPYAQAKESFKGVKDISGGALEKLGQLFVAGAKSYSWIKEHGPLKWGVDTIYRSKNNARTQALHILHDPKTGVATAWSQLAKREQAGLWKLIDQFDGKKDLTRDELVGYGMNEKQVNAYLASRTAFDRILAEFNAERAAQGLKPVAKRPGYWPHRWKGNWELIVRAQPTAAGIPGRIIHVERGNSRKALEALREKFARDGQFEVGDVESTPRGGEVKDTLGFYNQLIDTMDNGSPEREALKKAFERYAQELATERKYVSRHFEPVSGVGGYMGKRLGDVTPEQQAKEALTAMEGYLKDGLDWVHTNRANREISAFLRDAADLKLKNTAAFLQDYWNHSNGLESKMAHVINRAFEIVPELLGKDRNAVRNSMATLRHEATLLMLGYFKPAFLAAQITQGLQFAPPMMYQVARQLGVEPKKNPYVYVKDGYETAYGMLSNKGTAKASAFDQAAKQYLSENGIINLQFMETALDEGQAGRSNVLKMLRGESAMLFTEQLARSKAFYAFAHFLRDAMPNETNARIFSAAGDMTQQAMVNYAKTERARVYSHFGTVGDMAAALSTFRMNLSTQLYKYGKEAVVNRNMKPLAALLGTQFLMSGLLGLPGREELDSIVNLARKFGYGWDGMKTPTEGILMAAHAIDQQGHKLGADMLRYGSISSLTGVDISPTFSAGALMPEMSFKGFFPVLAKLSGMTGAAIDMAKEAPSPTTAAKARVAQEFSPAVMSGAIERSITGPNGIVPDPKKGMQGTVRRPTDPMAKEWMARDLGARTTSESTDMRAAMAQQQQDMANQQRKKSLLEKAKRLQADNKDWSSLVKEWQAAGGDPTEFIQGVVRHELDKATTRKERDAMGATSQARLKRYMMMRQMGYE